MDRQSLQHPSDTPGHTGSVGQHPVAPIHDAGSRQYGAQAQSEAAYGQRLAPAAFPAGEENHQSYGTADNGSQEPAVEDVDEVSWTASEFIAHHKTSSWYLTLGVSAAIVAAIVLLLTKDVFSTVIVVIAAILFGVAASRQPRELEYAVGSHALIIGNKQYPYRDFRSFSVVDEGAFSSIIFMPLKRFAPPISIYYHPGDEQYIVEALADHLPMDTHKPDMTEALMRRIRF